MLVLFDDGTPKGLIRARGAYVPDLPGCVAAGETREEALALIRDAIEVHLEGLKLNGQVVPSHLLVAR